MLARSRALELPIPLRDPKFLLGGTTGLALLGGGVFGADDVPPPPPPPPPNNSLSVELVFVTAAASWLRGEAK